MFRCKVVYFWFFLLSWNLAFKKIRVIFTAVKIISESLQGPHVEVGEQILLHTSAFWTFVMEISEVCTLNNRESKTEP